LKQRSPLGRGVGQKVGGEKKYHPWEKERILLTRVWEEETEWERGEVVIEEGRYPEKEGEGGEPVDRTKFGEWGLRIRVNASSNMNQERLVGGEKKKS